jgi:copper chaperone NosL
VNDRVRAAAPALALLAVLACAGPASGPPQVHWGTDECDHCHMILSEPRFAAVVRDASGQESRFDDVGCLAGWWAENARDHATAWVQGPAGSWLVASSAWFAPTGARTPMGSGLVAFPTAEAATAATPRGDHALSWQELLTRFRQARDRPPAGPAAAATPATASP